MSNISMKQLAAQLNLSVATVSKALKDSHEISGQTKKRVLDLAAQLNYTPNPFASSLRKGRSKTIAVVLPDVANSYFSQVINGVQSIAHDKGYHVLIYLTKDSHVYEEAILKDFSMTGRVDGVIISVSSETMQSAHIKALQSKDIPVVFVGRSCDDVATARITTNDFDCGYDATKHLIANGCRRIALLTISKSLSISHKRIEGYKKALEQYNVSFFEEDIVHATTNEHDNELLISELMKRDNRPDGIIVTGERLTIKLYAVCEAMNIAMPGDLKVISFSNIACAEILKPSLTTVSQPAFEMGKTATSLLFSTLQNKYVNLGTESQVIASLLHIRASTQNDKA